MVWKTDGSPEGRGCKRPGEGAGEGCAACRELEKVTRQAMAELGQTDGMEYVTDPARDCRSGCVSTPALMGRRKDCVQRAATEQGRRERPAAGKRPMSKPVVAFVCVHNACRSQIAKALCRLLAGDVLESCSAGTEPKDRIDPNAVRLMRTQYGVEMERSQHPKSLEALKPVDILITMGCGVSCPTLPCRLREDWGMEDPTGCGDAAYENVIQQIRQNVLELRRRLEKGLILQ